MSARTIDFQYRILRNGADFCEIHPGSNGWPSIRMSDSAEIKTSMSGSFQPPKEDINWLSDEIAPMLILNGTEYALGIFRAATVEPDQNETGISLRIEAYDRAWLARDSKLQERQYFADGTNYVEAASSLLASSGISYISATATNQTLAEAREDWEIGTSRLSIVNELLQEINYSNVWFDADGLARIEPYTEVTAANIKHIIDAEDKNSFLLPGMQRSMDIYNSPNVFVAICSNADKPDGMMAIAENQSGQSPLSITRRGRRIVQVTRVNNIASQEELQAFVNRQLTDSLVSGETIQIKTGLMPGFGVGEVTALQYGDIFALCRERAWTMQLQPGGTMTHTLERQVLQIG